MGEIPDRLRKVITANGGSPNGGTIASAHHTFSSGAAEKGRDLFLLSPGHKSRALDPIEKDPKGVVFDKDVKAWVAPFPMSVIDTRVVRRSCSLLGIDAAYQEYIIARGTLAPVFAAGVAAGTAVFYKAMQSAMFRDLMRNLVQAGKGPSDEVMDNGRFSCRFLGRANDGRTATATIAGQGDPANRITVKCVCESALALACDLDGLPKRGGVLTPSVGLGEVLARRLRARGIAISPDESG